MLIIENQTFDQERALYGQNNIKAVNCRFEGAADGESAFKECRNAEVSCCEFHLRYPFWHDDGLKITGSNMYETCRAALWYSEHIDISDCRLHGIKALRECSDVKMENCDIISPEFGWSVDGLTMRDCTLSGEYAFMRSSDLDFYSFSLNGKYSFQYIEDAKFESCTLNTKDAFWHAKNVYVKNCTIKGEYLAWYSENITFESCTIIGTQPLCYCKGLKLINCETTDCDLAFEKSEVEATITNDVISIKNVLSGTVKVKSVGEIICDEDWAKGKIETL